MFWENFCFCYLITGALFDATQSYNLPFIVSGLLFALSGIVCLPIRRVSLWEKSKSRRYDVRTATAWRRCVHFSFAIYLKYLKYFVQSKHTAQKFISFDRLVHIAHCVCIHVMSTIPHSRQQTDVILRGDWRSQRYCCYLCPVAYLMSTCRTNVYVIGEYSCSSIVRYCRVGIVASWECVVIYRETAHIWLWVLTAKRCCGKC
jgi:hypothetical protein